MQSHTRLFAASLCLALALGLCAVVAPGVRSQNDATRRRITHTPERTLNLNPNISGDGRRIAFESTVNQTGASSSAGFHTLRADITSDGATFTAIAASRAPAPAVSRDGSRLAFASRENLTGENPDGNSEIFLYDGVTVRTCWQHLPTSSYNL